ncbi:zinc/iron-chelating domain-containing protein, partial [Pseudidiomarina aestuarii]
TEAFHPHLLCMQGTNQKQPRCVALDGEIGVQVGCTIYANRPSPCREFIAGDEGENPFCDKARAQHGLPPLIPIKIVA